MERKNNIKKINAKYVRQTLAFCFLLFFPFNNTISGKIIFGSINPCIFALLGILLLLPNMKKKVSRKIVCLVFAEIAATLFVLSYTNLSGRYEYTFIQIIYLLILPILANTNIDKKAAVTAITIFSIEHILGTLFPIILPDLYESSFLPFVCNASSGYCPARIAFLSGMNAGITAQSSTNGCYMAIFALFYASRYSVHKERKTLLFTIATISCLLVIGKRAHLLFTLLAIIAMYVTKKQKFDVISFFKKNLKIIAIIAISLIGTFAISSTVPQINSTINRIVTSTDRDDPTSGRIPLYELAIEKWKESPILGNGWGAYTAASHERFGKTYGVSYIRAHNDYLEILCDKGIAGLILYIALLICILKKTHDVRNNGCFEKFAFSYTIFYVLYGFTGTPLYIISNFVFLLIAILIKGKEDEKNRCNHIS